jgi:putative molybdopterin biosynthesis protein
MVILSGGTSKSAGDLTYRVVARLGEPGIIAHGVALKPGKPLCLAVVEGKPVVILPGFPTSAMFTFHDFVVPVLRAMAGLPIREELSLEAVTSAPILSDPGRTEFVMVALTQAEGGLHAFPLGKSSGSITSFAQADGFLTIPALAEALAAGSLVKVTLFDPDQRIADLTVIGSHCIGLEILFDELAQNGIKTRTVAVGSLGGLNAAKRGESDIAPIHLFDLETQTYNAPFLTEGMALVKGWRRMQGFVFRKGDIRFNGKDANSAIAAALADPACHMVNRNSGAGTRMLIDQLIGAARPEGYWNQPKSHNAVAAAVAQYRADWGIAIEPIAKAYDLGFLPITEEHYDFAVPREKLEHSAVKAFIASLGSQSTQAALCELGLIPAALTQAADSCE